MKKELSPFVIYTLLIIAMVFWSFAFIWIKQLLNIGFLPLTIVFFRLIIAASFMTLLCYFLNIQEKIHRQDYKYLFLLAFAEPFCYFLGENFGMQYVSASLASLMVALIPPITPIFAWIFIKEKVCFNQIIGLVISFLGVIVLVAEDWNLQGTINGVLLMLLAVLSGTVFTILLRRLVNKYSALTITKWQTIIGMLLYLPLFFLFDFQKFIHTRFVIYDYKNIICLGALASSIAFVFLTMGVKRIGVVRTNIFTNLIPVFAGVFAFFVLREPLTTAKIIAMLIVLAGLFMSQAKREKK